MNRTSDTNSSQEFLSVVRELYGRVVWTQKTHEKDRERWSRWVAGTRWANVLLVGITSILATVGAICDSQVIFIITSVFGAVSTGFIVCQLSFNPEKKESEHRIAAKRLLYLRDQYLILIQETMTDSLPLKELQNRLKALQREVSVVYEYAPDSSAQAYTAAGDALKNNEELTFAPEEIDLLLPEGLRLTAQAPQEEEGNSTG